MEELSVEHGLYQCKFDEFQEVVQSLKSTLFDFEYYRRFTVYLKSCKRHMLKTTDLVDHCTLSLLSLNMSCLAVNH